MPLKTFLNFCRNSWHAEVAKVRDASVCVKDKGTNWLYSIRNLTVLLSRWAREENVSISTATENLDVDFKVCVPLPVLNMRYIDEDLHIRRQLTVELTGNGRMFQCEVLYDKLKNTVTELSSSLTKVSNNAIPMYKMIAQEPILTLNVGEKIATLKPRKQNCCTKCGNPTKGHLGPTGNLCNMNKC